MDIVLECMERLLDDAVEDFSDDELVHYGIKRRSGRYPYGSGEDPYQHENMDFLGRVEKLRKSNFEWTDENGKKFTGDTAIAKSMGYTPTQFRAKLGVAKAERRALQVETAKRLKEKEGLNDTEIGRRMGVNESTVRGWFNKDSEQRMNQARQIADTLKARSEELIKSGKMGMIDVGLGVEKELNISREKMNQALYLLREEGYDVKGNRFEQPTNRGKFTTQTVLLPPGVEHKDVYNLDEVGTVKDYISRDGGKTLEKKFYYPASLDSSRLKIRYSEEGGLEHDGLVEIRPGCADLSLGSSRYAQVRILVDDTHYIKGMAVYSDDLPKGVDVMFNTNKHLGTPMKDVLKKIKKDDPDNPFGSAIKDADQGGQYFYDPKTGERVSASTEGAKLGLINKRADEGDWNDWKDSLPSQFLAKQSKTMIKKQLDLAKADKEAELETIMELTNPTIKKYYLEKFADGCDSAAVSLKAAALPGQRYHVMIPVNTLRDGEIYAPGYETGTKLALIRYPHGGIFEIPVLTVNNNNPEGKKWIGPKSLDAVCVNKRVADQLSGADFDGDTVMTIPTDDDAGRVRVARRPYLDGLVGYECKEMYGPTRTWTTTDEDGNEIEHAERNGKEYAVMSEGYKQKQMGVVSNLITDMTLKGADDDELAAAVRHSMTVIDAVKHKLDYRQSAIDNNIAYLHEKYQGKPTGGASTIISRAKGEDSVVKRQGSGHINQKGKPWYDPNRPEGVMVWAEADDAHWTETKVNKRTGEEYQVEHTKTQKTTKMMTTDDARTLIGDPSNEKEILYADYANSMKALAIQARKALLATPNLTQDTAARKTYAAEYDSLMLKLNEAEKNKPRERAALRMANVEVENKKAAVLASTGKEMSKEDVRKLSARATKSARSEVGSVPRKERNIEITDREWEAIQAGAISENKLKRILNNTDADKLRERSMPKERKELSPVMINKIKRMCSSNYTLADIAEVCGCSVATVSKYAKGA